MRMDYTFHQPGWKTVQIIATNHALLEDVMQKSECVININKWKNSEKYIWNKNQPGCVRLGKTNGRKGLLTNGTKGRVQEELRVRQHPCNQNPNYL